MKSGLRIFGVLLVLLVISGAVFVVCARSGLLTPSEASIRAKYMLPTSKFIDIGGEQIHYSDEGSGIPIVLVHGASGSLLMWNDWAKAFSAHYRVIRFDRPPSGLSGPDPKNDYSVEHEAGIIDGLTTALGLDRFFLAVTSGAGASGVEYAVTHPEHIEGLILANIPVGLNKPLPGRYSDTYRKLLKIDPIFKVWRTRWELRAVLEANMINREKITDALVEQFTDLNNRPLNYSAKRDPAGVIAAFERIPDELGKISAPTLLLWSENDGDTPPDPHAKNGLRLLASQDKSLIIIPHCEHMMPLDCGPQSAAAALSFLDRVSAAGH